MCIQSIRNDGRGGGNTQAYQRSNRMQRSGHSRLLIPVPVRQNQDDNCTSTVYSQTAALHVKLLTCENAALSTMDDLPGRVTTVPSAGCDSVQPVVVAKTMSLPDEDVDETPSAGSVGLEQGKSCEPQDTVRKGDPTMHIHVTQA